MPHNDSDLGGSSESEVIFEDNGDYIETNLITEEDLKSYRLHVATQEGSKGAPLNEALPAIELAKIIYKRRKLKEDAKEVEEREKSIEKLRDKLKKKKKKKNRSRSKSPKSKKNRQYRQKKSDSRSRSKSPKRSKSKSKSPKKSKRSRSKSKSPKISKRSKSKSKSPKKSKRSKSKSKSPKKSKHSKSKSKSPKKSSKPRKGSRSKSPSRTKSKRRSRSRKRDSGRHSRRGRRSRSRSGGRSRRRRKKIWESKSRSRSRSDSRDKDDYVRKCKSIQDGPDLPVSRPVDRRRRRRSRSRSSSSSVERPARGLPSSSSYLAIEGPEMDKALVTLYPSATPSLAAPTLDRVRLPPALAQQLFPVSCGSDHKTEESEKAAASVLAIEGPKEEGEETEEEEGEVKAPPSLSEIMQMRIEANKLLLKDPSDLAAKKILHEAQILMNQWQASTVRSAGGRYTGAPLTTPLPKELLDSHHPLTWARKDMFLNLAPITESPGILLMMKMGWSSGQGLGKEGTGDVNPLQLCVKTDRKGLMAGQEVLKKNPAAERGANVVGCNWVLKIVNGKHAVSGLGEIHQHIGRPCPEYMDHPSSGVHQITCKTAWGQFTPPSAAPSKKEAKGRAALWALKKILAIEADKYNQTCPEEAPTSSVMSVLFKTTTPGQNAKYNANFNDPNKVYINVKNISAAISEQNAVQSPQKAAQSVPTLPPGVPHLRPPAQQTPLPPRPNTGSLHQQSIDSLISSQRIAAENLSSRPVKREPLMAASEHRLTLRQPRLGGPPRTGGPTPPRAGGPTPLRAGGPTPSRLVHPNRPFRPPLPRSVPVPPPRPPTQIPVIKPEPMLQGAQPIQGNIQQMIAMATKITGHMRPPPPR